MFRSRHPEVAPAQSNKAAGGNTNKGRMHTGGRERQPESKFRQQSNVPNAEKTETPKSNPTPQSKSDYKRPVESRADPEIVEDYQRRVQALRDKFMRSIMREEGNVGIADINIEGIDTKTMSAHSKNRIPSDLLVGDGNTKFDYLNLPSINKDGTLTKSYSRSNDAEYKLLSNIADKLGNNTGLKGNITIFSEKPVCDSCSNVARQFKECYPNITINMIDGNGKVLTY
nr:deaminase domain-containing protein [uncultured Kingella sp.]